MRKMLLSRWLLLVVMVLAWARCGDGTPSLMPKQEQAFTLVQARFAPLFQEQGPEPAPLAEPPVYWWTTNCPGTTKSAVMLGATCYSGLFYRGDAVDVAWRGSFGVSAYSHELMHYYLAQHTGDSDPDHLQTALWAQVQDADVALQAQGL